MHLFGGIAIPFLGTAFGAAMVFLMKNSLCRRVEKVLLGVASGVMIAASVWSLLIPAIDLAEEKGGIPWITVSVGFSLGIVFLLLIDALLGRLQTEKRFLSEEKGGKRKISMMVFVVTLHNLPEGMAVGVSFAGALLNDSSITMAGAFALAVGIAIQNVPEGAIISMPLRSLGFGKGKAFFLGVLSGLVEPVGAVITLKLTELVVPLLPYLLSFAAGAMVYVVVEELLPSIHQEEGMMGEEMPLSACQERESKVGIIGFAAGFVLMMALDVALG